MKLNCAGDYELQRLWLEKHKDADLIEYDVLHDLPSRAIYVSSIYQSYVTDPANFFRQVRKQMEDGE